MSVRYNKQRDQWCADFSYHGRRIYKAFSSKALALRYERDMKIQEEKEVAGLAPRRRILFRELAALFVQQAEQRRARNTVKWYKGRIRTFHAPFFGHRFVHEITRADIEGFLSDRLKVAKKCTVEKDLEIMKAVLSFAETMGYINQSPARGVPKLKYPKKKFRFLNKNEIEAVLESAGPRRLFYLTAILTGMRKEELAHFRWEWINWDQKLITIQPDHDWSTKNYESRTVPLHPDLATALLPRKSDHGLVFGSPGTRFTRRTHDRIVEETGIANFVLHDTRHTFASQLVMAGVPLKTVSELLGHKSIRMTEIYAHLSPDHHTQAISKFTLFMGENGPGASDANHEQTEKTGRTEDQLSEPAPELPKG